LALYRLDEAMVHAARSREITDSLVGKLTGEGAARIRARSRTILGSIDRMRGDYGEAEATLLETVAILEQALGHDHPETAEALNNLAMIYKYTGQFDKGKCLYLRALETLRAARGEDSLATATVYHNLGGIEHARGNYRAAEPYARRACEI